MSDNSEPAFLIDSLLHYTQFNFASENLNRDALKLQLSLFQQEQLLFFLNGVNVTQLIQQRSYFIDRLLRALCHHFLEPCWRNDVAIALIATGGYGRKELHPFSDIDLLFLTSSNTLTEVEHSQIAQLLALLWDIGLHISHSIRNLNESLLALTHDLSFFTSVLESRPLWGDETLYYALQQQLQSHKHSLSDSFFLAKYAEQQNRHQHYNDTSYNLEPDIKMGIGGLRDIHLLQWIGQFYFHTHSLVEMKNYGLLLSSEVDELLQCRLFLWRVRFALHSLLTRPDNRLLFENQFPVAEFLGYEGTQNSAIEKMMQNYYLVTQRINELNDILLSLFAEGILNSPPSPHRTILDTQFQLNSRRIEIKDSSQFQQHPELIIALFYHIACNPDIVGISPTTLRHLHFALKQLSMPLSTFPRARSLFMKIVTQEKAISRALLWMHKYGVLASYLPEWKMITGQMQFDLFHIYTVDEHTLKTLLNLEAMQTEKIDKKEHFYLKVYQKLPKHFTTLLFLAGLFHDIGKTKKGDHSILGAAIFISFAQQHGLSEEDTSFVVWLIENHLLMSNTAQRRDIDDPEVIFEFSQLISSDNALNCLLCLTVADISATNNNLWNHWKASLLEKLYLACQKQLETGPHSLPSLRRTIRDKQLKVQVLLEHTPKIALPLILFWRSCRAEYFLRHSVEELTWHATAILSEPSKMPLVLLTNQMPHGGTTLFIYTQDRHYLFAIVAGELSRRRYSIQSANISTNRHNYVMDSFVIFDNYGRAISLENHSSLQRMLSQLLLQLEYSPVAIRKTPLQLSHFTIETRFRFTHSHSARYTYLELVTLDKPGILAQLGEIFSELNITLHSARINTLGESAEDFFTLSQNDKPLTPSLCNTLQARLKEKF